MDRKWISIVLAALLAAGALAVGARQWQKPRRNGLAEANSSPAAPARTVESASPAAMVQAPATAPAASSSAGLTTSQAAGPSASPNGPNGGSPIEETKSAGGKPGWKTYTSAEYGFEIQDPANWTYNADFEGTKGKPRSGKAPAYAGETRSLFNLEMVGPDQDQEGGGDFSDGTIVRVKVTGTDAVHESWTINKDDQWYVTTSTLEKWVEDQYASFGDNRLECVSMGTNGFKGTVAVGHDDGHPEKIFGEAGGAYRIVPSGRAVLIEWYRLNVDYDKANDFSYQNYLQPMLASFRLLSPSAKN